MPYKKTSFLQSPEKAFILIGMVFGILFLLLTPPLQGNDEWSHFFRTFQISEGHMIAQKDQTGHVGENLPSSLLITAVSVFYNIPFYPENEAEIKNILYKGVVDNPDLNPFTSGRKMKKEVILSLFGMPLDSPNRVLVYFAGAALTSPIPYLPQVAGFALGRALAMPPIALIYLGRMFNLAFWVFLIYLAIRTTPVLKWLFSLLALTPTSIFQSATLSPDGFTNGLSFLLIALFFKCSFDGGKEVKAPAVFVIFLLSMLLSVSKAYFILPCLFLLIPAEKIGSKKKYFLFFFLLLTLSVSSSAVWLSLVKDIYIPFRAGVSAGEQMSFILSSPLKYALIMFKTFVQNCTGYMREFAGKLGHFELYLPTALIILHWIMLVFVSLSDRRKDIIISSKGKAVGFVVFLSSSVLIATLLYLSWTPVGLDAIEGVQGRYFIPIAPLLFLMLYGKLPVLREKTLNLIVICYSVFSLTSSAIVILKGYYL